MSGQGAVSLHDGDRVAIVGGGPAGSFAALHLLRLAAARGLRLEVLIFEPHDPGHVGPRSCKGCAGILSNGLIRNLAGLGLAVPPEVVQSELRAYVVHVAGQVTSIQQPDPGQHILSVFRGAGPRLHTGAPVAGFDAYLLGEACRRGARHVPARVRRVEWENGPLVHTDQGPFPAHFLVLATGANSRPPLAPVFGYDPPGTVLMAQDEVRRPPNWPAGKVAGFFDQPQGLIFGAIVPKGPYLNVSLLWRNAPPDAIGQFFAAQAPALDRFFGGMPESLCGCSPRILDTPAANYFGDRWVAVGDAAVSRLYKDGINSAFVTSGRAMRSALERGISRESFRGGYAPLCEQIAADNRFGALLYTASSYALQNPLLASACVGCVRDEAGVAAARRTHSRLMWGMLTGDESYRELFRLALHPRGLVGLGRNLLRSATQGRIAL